jgi:hypothetical protein
MRLSFSTPLSPEECVAELPAAVERCPVPEPLVPERTTGWFTSGDKHPVRVRTRGFRVRISPRYPWPLFSSPLFSGRVRRTDGGSLLQGRVQPPWLTVLFFAIWFTPVGGLWLILAFAYVRCTLVGAPLPDTLEMLPMVSGMLAVGLLVAFTFYRSIRREATALRELIGDAVGRRGVNQTAV